MREITTLSFVLFCCLVFGQEKPKMVPDWVWRTPISGNDTYYYVKQKANGATQREARNLAIAQAFMQANYFGGTTINAESLNKAIQDDISYEVISEGFRIPLNIVCEFEMKNEDDGSWDYWILCQIAKRGNISPRFEPYIDCDKDSISRRKLEEYYETYASEIKKKKKMEQQLVRDKEREEDRERRKAELDAFREKFYNDQSKYVEDKKNHYVAVTIAGASYPWNIHTSVEYRNGGTMGYGVYGELGIGFTIEPMEYSYTTRFNSDYPNVYFYYSAGVKFYPYKGLFAGCGYGSYMPYYLLKSQEDKYDKVYVNDKDSNGKPYYYYKRNHGMHFVMGYDWYSGGELGVLLGIKGGIIYDVVNNVVLPTISLRFGVGFLP